MLLFKIPPIHQNKRVKRIQQPSSNILVPTLSPNSDLGSERFEMSNSHVNADTDQQLQQLQQLPLDAPTRTAISILMSSLQVMQTDLSSMKQLQEQYNAVVEQNKTLAEKNSALEAEVIQLRKDLANAAKPASTTNNSSVQQPVQSIAPSGTAASSWATLAARHTPPKRSTRKVAAAARVFSEPDTSSLKGFEYIYIPRSRRLSYRETRAKLRTLGIDTYRIIDISFPARSTVGLLIHIQYRQELLDTLAQAKIKPIKDFDPTDPKHLADPKYKDYTDSDRITAAMVINRDRCVRALLRMPHYLAVNVSKIFGQAGYLDDDTISDTLAHCDGAPRYQSRDDPATQQSSDTAMEDDDVSDYSGATGAL